MPRREPFGHRRSSRWVQDRLSGKALKWVMPCASAEAWEQLSAPRRSRWCDPEHAEAALADIDQAVALLDPDCDFVERKSAQDGYTALITLALDASELAAGAGSYGEVDDLLDVVRRAHERHVAMAAADKRRRLIVELRREAAGRSVAATHSPSEPPRLRIVR